jgi:hypothetical protein
MYPWLWGHLPGPWPARVVQCTALLAAVVTALFLWVFPRVEAALPYQDVTVPNSGGATPIPTPTPNASPSSR